MNYKTFYALIFLIGFVQFYICAQGQLLITPARVVFKTNNIKEIINLVNTGEKTESYTVSFVQRRMNEDGSFTEITEPDPDENFADAHLRIYPRSITLKPGEGQVVMLQRRRDGNNKPGEYRSHLYFRSNTNYEALGKTVVDTLTGVDIKLTPVFGMTIPIIFRTGNTSANATLSDLKLDRQEDSNQLNFTLNRAGNRSLYGDFTVNYFPVKGESITIAQLNGVAIYTTINKRFMSINLPRTPSINFDEGTIKITYKTRPGEEKQRIFAESILPL
jgi:P pilus assembly chaperone PapD